MGVVMFTSSSMTVSVPLPMPAEIAGLFVVLLPLLAEAMLEVVVVVVVGVKVPFGPRPNINEVALRPATFVAGPEIAARCAKKRERQRETHAHKRHI